MLKSILIPFSIAYGSIMAIRNWLYDVNIFQSIHFANIKTIVVGNLRLGGTGKSPFTAWLVKKYNSKLNTVVLSRGYGRNTKGFIEVTIDKDVHSVGDEPLNYKLTFPELGVFVCEDRVEGIRKIKELYPQTQLVILDDAFQHRKLKADVNIALTDYNQPYYNDRVVPAGRLREFASGIKRADVIVVSKCPGNITEDDKKEIISHIKPTSKQKVVFSYVKYQKINTEINSNTNVILITGIANPKPLVKHLSNTTKNIKHFDYPDHYTFSESDIKEITTAYNELDGIKIVITTGKDAVRLNKLWPTNIPLHIQQIEIETTNSFDLNL